MASSRIVIDSRLRDSGTCEDYEYSFSSPIRNVAGVTLLAALLPKSSYNVITGFNDTINFDYNGAGPFTAVLDSQNYSGAQLAAALVAGMNSAASTSDFAGTYDSQANTITLTTSSNNFDIDAQTTTPQFEKLSGFTNTASGVMTFTGENMVNTSWPLYVLLDLDFSTSQGFGESTRLKNNTYTMVVPFGSAGSNEFEYYTQDMVAAQGQKLTDVNIMKVRVRLRPPDTSDSDAAPPANWSLNNVDHILVFGIRQAY